MIAAIIQARMGSTRLPGKSMMNLAGKPVIRHVVRRVSLARSIDHVLVATTTDPGDDTLAACCNSAGIDVFRGSPDDVLRRYRDAMAYLAANGVQADYIVRITGDCPLIDPAVIDRVVRAATKGQYDYASNTNPPTYPDGLDVEVMRASVLETAHINARLPSEREHVTPYIRNNEHFSKYNVRSPVDYSSLRWTLDHEEDYRFFQSVYGHLYNEDEAFSMSDILDLLKVHPEIAVINARYQRNEGYVKSLHDELHPARNEP